MDIVERLKFSSDVNARDAVSEINRLRADRDMLHDALAAILVRVNQPSFGMGRDIRELAEKALKPNAALSGGPA